MNKIISCVKKLVFAPFVLYIYNLIAVYFGYLIPINVFSIMLVAFLGIPALVMLLLMKLFLF